MFIENEKLLNDLSDTDEEDENDISKPILHETQIQQSANVKVRRDEEEKLKSTLFVGNISVATTEKELKRLFSKYGVVESVRFRSVAFSDPALPKKAAFILKKFNNGKDSMNSYVVMATEKAARAALVLNSTEFNGKTFRVDMAVAPKESVSFDESRSVFVGNLPLTISDDAVRKFFSSCGLVSSVRLVRDSTTQLGKGFGFVLFESANSVKLALSLHGGSLEGRELRIFKSSKEKGDKYSQKVAPKSATGKFDKPKKVKHAARKAAQAAEALAAKKGIAVPKTEKQLKKEAKLKAKLEAPVAPAPSGPKVVLTKEQKEAKIQRREEKLKESKFGKVFNTVSTASFQGEKTSVVKTGAVATSGGNSTQSQVKRVKLNY